MDRSAVPRRWFVQEEAQGADRQAEHQCVGPWAVKSRPAAFQREQHLTMLRHAAVG
jgi:hypothetical protein